MCCGRAGLAWPAACPQRPRGLGAARLGWWVLPSGWGTGTGCCGIPVPAVPVGGEGMLMERGAGLSRHPGLCWVFKRLREDKCSPLLLCLGETSQDKAVVW